MNESKVTSESEIRRKVAELLVMGPRHGVSRFVSEVRKQLPIPDEKAVEVLVRALCAQNSTWIGGFRKAVTRGHKCPRQLRTVLERCLSTLDLPAAGHPRLTPSDIVRRARRAKFEATLAIDDSLELGWGREHRYLIAKLHDLALRPGPVDLSVHFRCDQLYVHGLGLLAAWCDRQAAKVQLRADSVRTERYLEATGFKRVVEGLETIDSALYDSQNHVALTRVDREDQDAADQVAGRLVELFAKHIDLDRSQQSALQIIFAELVENVYRHACSTYPAYVMAQAFPTTQKLHIVVADTGIGIYQSFRQSKSRETKDRAATERKAIEMALEKLVTSKPDRHSGYGLFVVRRLVQLNGGVMRLMSGRTTIRYWGTQRPFLGLQSSHEISDNLPWKGTEVSLMFNLDRPLPLKQVWRELGPLPDQEDFFD